MRVRVPILIEPRREWFRSVLKHKKKSGNYTFIWPCIVTSLFVIKPTRCTNFTNLFCHETLHVSKSSSVHHQKFIHCTFSNGICHTCLQTAFERDQDGPARKLWWTDEQFETCRVSWKNKFVKLVHLFGFITKKSGNILFKNWTKWLRIVSSDREAIILVVFSL
jgi:hypothetical protein